MVKLKGYMGRVLFVDLTNKTYRDFPWSDEDRKRTLGGKIMAADILFHHVKKGMTAFDEDNWVVCTTGPLTGCGCPNTSRFNISTISPLTNIVTSSNCGGDFGLLLKRTGYDGVIFTGKAEIPTRVHITEDDVQFIDATELWGTKTLECQEKLPEKYGKIVIGPAGENKVLYACVFSGERTAGRGGVGAVFGSKNLKAVTAFGVKMPEIADKEKLQALNVKWSHTLRTHPLTGKQLPRLGTAGLVSQMQAHSILATKNFSAGRFDNFDLVSGETLTEKHLVRNAACTTCVIRCARMVNVDDRIVKGPELEILGLMGPNILNDDMESILKWNYEIDELGMDAISIAGTIAFAMELKEKGLWDCGLEFGRNDNVSQIIDDIAHRRGDGNILADGSKRMADRFGGMDFAIQSKGMELSAYEPRHAVGQGLGYATSNRGGCHLNAGYLVVAEGLGMDIDALTPHGKAALNVTFQNLMEAVSASGSCLFTSYAVFPGFLIDKPNMAVTRIVMTALPYLGPVVNMINKYPEVAQINLPLLPHPYAIHYATGMRANMGSILLWGAHGWNCERMANVILGQKANADRLPKKLTDMEQQPGNRKTKVPLDKMLPAYYRGRGWKDGIPMFKTLKKYHVDMFEYDYKQAVKEAY